MAFEAAEKEINPQLRRAWLTFVIVSGGPTDVELAGAIAKLAHQTLKEDFCNIDTTQAQILILESLDRVLPSFAPELSTQAAASLEKLGVIVQTKTLVTNIEGDFVTIEQDGQLVRIHAKTVLWAAGVKALPIGKVLAKRTGVECDRAGE
jgi:NADH dehydrogenase